MPPRKSEQTHVLTAIEGLENLMTVRFAEVDRRFDEVDRRFDHLEAELSAVKVEVRATNGRVGKLETKMSLISWLGGTSIVALAGTLARRLFP